MGAQFNYRGVYLKLFAATEDALEQLERNNVGLAREILISAQREAEEAVLKADELSDE